jgi:hypothetical protein
MGQRLIEVFKPKPVVVLTLEEEAHEAKLRKVEERRKL